MKLYNIYNEYVTIEKARFGNCYLLFFSGIGNGARYADMIEAVQHAYRMGYTRQYPTT